LGLFSAEMGCPRDVRFSPGSDRPADIAGGPFRARTGNEFFDRQCVDWLIWSPRNRSAGLPF